MISPTISVLMTVYNGEQFLQQAVDSVLAQTFTDFEFVIIDDGSFDGTWAILSGYAQHDPRVRIFRQENAGRAAALNRAIEYSRCSLLARMDADDISIPNRLEKQFEFMEAHPEVGLLAGGVELVTIQAQTIRIAISPLTDAEIRSAMVQSNPFFPVVMMRKSTVKAAGGYRKALGDADDYDLYLRIGEHRELASLPDVILKYRIHPNQVSLRKNQHQVECLLAARAAAELRAKGGSDPLWNANAVTPEILDTLGIGTEELRRRVLRGQLYWLNLVAEFYPQAALEINDRVLTLCTDSAAERKLAVDVLFRSASIYRKSGRLGKAVAAVGRAIAAQPREAGRHMKMAVARRLSHRAGSSPEYGGV